MSRCNQCKVEILDEAKVCPLCHSVLEETADMEDAYPDIRFKSKLKVLFARIYLFLAITAETLLISVSIYEELDIMHSIITGIILAYIYLLIKYAILGTYSYRLKGIIVAMITIGSMLAIDYFSGFYKWSVNYVLPGVILGLNAAILIMMIINHRNWQSYMILQIVTIIISLCQFILLWLDIITNPIVVFIACYVSLLFFLGTFIIGGRRARIELTRRFHI